ncbi:hypothetical protein CN213_18440 [Sinorhizobium meliloti]|uniref:hypothetical protein n=1 Tax=Rhizobium meliloti TaxID=382 RepID=UPI000FDBF4AE|nr:hypothetical protein [Sinorhizobium meliloti]RVH55359.1 hypothetical protein CN213_18440 [Sinorhizobium meliloti]
MSIAEVLSKAARSDGGLRGANWSGGPLGGLRNKIINGDFDIWQRGASAVNISGYLADRWRTTASGATGLSVSRQDFVLGQTDVPGNPKHFYRLSFTAGNDYARTEQPIEDVRTLAGKAVTVTFWAKGTNPGGGKFYSYLGHDFGSGGSPSAGILTLEPHPFIVTNSWQKFSVVKQVPSIAGKTLGTDGNSRLFLSFGQFDDLSAAGWTLDLSHVSLVEGDATGEDDPFSPRHPQQELVLCQRYYQTLGANALIGVSSSTTAIRVVTPFPQMRARPTAALLDDTIAVMEEAVTKNSTASALDFITGNERCMRFNISGFTGLTLGKTVFTDNGGVDIIALDADL